MCVLIDAECLEAPPNLILSYNVRSHTLGSLIQVTYVNSNGRVSDRMNR